MNLKITHYLPQRHCVNDVLEIENPSRNLYHKSIGVISREVETMMNFHINSCKDASILLVLCLVVSSTAGEAQKSSKSYPITTLINAKWEQTPIHLEIAEYLADENSNMYWDFVKDASDLDTPLSSYGK